MGTKYVDQIHEGSDVYRFRDLEARKSIDQINNQLALISDFFAEFKENATHFDSNNKFIGEMDWSKIHYELAPIPSMEVKPDENDNTKPAVLNIWLNSKKAKS